MKWLAPFALLLLASCDRAPTYNEKYRADEERHAKLNPTGRYEMVPAGKEGADIFLLDTRTGQLRRCWFGVKDQLKVTCGDPSPALTALP